MECNKDDATKAAELAEKKYMLQDLAGARKFCNKALQLYPNLERAKQMLAVVEVHTAAEQKIQGLEDWYGILQADPLSDEASIKKQYKKMALLLHPDKNRLSGAEPAFKLINEAWIVLSDKSKKSLYDVKRSATLKKTLASTLVTSDSAIPSPNPNPNPSPNLSPTADDVQAAGTSTNQDNSQTHQGQPTFWTQCPSCKIQYQYYKKFENFQLLCHRCKTGFIAKDIGVPPAESSSWKPATTNNSPTVNGVHEGGNAFQQMQQRAREREERRREDERRKAEREREREEKRRLKEALRKAREEDRRREALERQMMKQKEREEKEARKRNMEALKKKLKKHRMEEDDDDDDDEDEEEDDSNDEGKAGEESTFQSFSSAEGVYRYGLRRSNRMRKNVTYRENADEDENGEPASKRAKGELPELTPEEAALKQTFVEFGLKLIREKALKIQVSKEVPKGVEIPKPEVQSGFEKVSETVSGKVSKPVLDNVFETVSEGSGKVSEEGSGKVSEALSEKVSDKVPEKVVPEKVPETSNGVKTVRRKEKAEKDNSDDEEQKETYIVPDPDFHNFDTDRKEDLVKEGQVWALYDDAEGMPRFYCEIRQVLSVNPFKVRIRWLERYDSSEEFENWEDAGFSVTCGDFKCKRKVETEEHFNKFSHVVEVEKVQANVMRIYPKKGEVWALYRDWSMKWVDMEYETMNVSYEMVEVMESYYESMTVLPLVKVDGYKTIFARGGEKRVFYDKDLLRFSHKVPSHWMSGNEKVNAPKDCWELDPAAMPAHLMFKDR